VVAHRTRRIAVAAVFSLVAGVAWVIVPAPAEESPDDAGPRRVHRDPEAVVASVLETTRALLAEDGHSARVAMDALNEATPPLDPDLDEIWGSEILTLDQGFHTTIDRVREYATAGRVEDAFNQFVWVERACLQCHGLVRASGKKVETATPSGR